MEYLFAVIYHTQSNQSIFISACQLLILKVHPSIPTKFINILQTQRFINPLEYEKWVNIYLSPFVQSYIYW